MARGFHMHYGAIHEDPPEKLKIGKADYAEFTKDKWIASIEQWKTFIIQDSRKCFFLKRISGHSDQFRYANQLLDLVMREQYQGIVNKIVGTEKKSVSSTFAKLVLLPLGKQAKGVLEQQQHPDQDLRSMPVGFNEDDFPMCAIL